jgi:prophage maintenance system killer protein
VNFADLNGWDLVADQVDIYRTISAVAAGELSLDVLEQWVSKIKTTGRT